jgi:hypothetical protein
MCLWTSCRIHVTLLALDSALSDSLWSVCFYFSNIMQINSTYSHWSCKINGSLLYQWSSTVMPPVSKARAANTSCCKWWSWSVEQTKELFKFQVSSWGNVLLLMTLFVLDSVFDIIHCQKLSKFWVMVLLCGMKLACIWPKYWCYRVPQKWRVPLIVVCAWTVMLTMGILSFQ